MKKMSTLFKVNYFGKGSKGIITKDVRLENTWVYTAPNVVATRKFDGMAVMVLGGKLYKRYDAKPTKEALKRHIEGTPWDLTDFKNVPLDAIPCQEPDLVTGHYPHWILVSKEDPSNKYLLATYEKETLEDGTYEFCGEKVGSNPEKVVGHKFFKHGSEILYLSDYSFDTLQQYLCNPSNDIEGIVFHNLDTGQMCKLRKTDFGVTRNAN